MKNSVIHHGRIIDPAQKLDQHADLFISNGKIAAIGQAPAGFVADEHIDASGCIVCPGLIDIYAGLNTTCFEQAIDIEIEAQVCARAGVTTLCMPPDRGLIADHPAVVKQFQQQQTNWPLSVYLLAAMTQGLKGESLSEMAGLKAAGCIGVSQGDSPLPNTNVLRRAFEYAASHDLTVFLQPQDRYLVGQGCAHEGQVGMRLGLPGIPETAETVAISTAILLAQQTGVRLHFNKISTAAGVNLIAQAQQQNLPISADVSAQHLQLTEMDISDFNSNCHMVPPLRTQGDREALCQALNDGIIQAVCSDHQPMSIVNKQAPFAASRAGVSGIETLLALTLKACTDVNTAIAALTLQPARILGLELGTLKIGSRADICVFDPEESWKVTAQNLLSQGKNSAVLEQILVGKTKFTFFAGKHCY